MAVGGHASGLKSSITTLALLFQKTACFSMPEQDCFERRSTVLVHLFQSRLNSGTRVATIDIIDSIVLVSRTVLLL